MARQRQGQQQGQGEGRLLHLICTFCAVFRPRGGERRVEGLGALDSCGEAALCSFLLTGLRSHGSQGIPKSFSPSRFLSLLASKRLFLFVVDNRKQAETEVADPHNEQAT